MAPPAAAADSRRRSQRVFTFGKGKSEGNKSMKSLVSFFTCKMLFANLSQICTCTCMCKYVSSFMLTVRRERGQPGRDGEHWAFCATGPDDINRSLPRIPRERPQDASWALGGDTGRPAGCGGGHGGLFGRPRQASTSVRPIRCCGMGFLFPPSY